MQCSQNIPYKEPVEPQKDKDGEGRDFSGSLAYAICKPVNIWSLEQQKNKGLDTSPGGRLADRKARGYTKARAYPTS